MRRKQRVPDIHFYEWSVIRWLGSDTRALLDPAGRGIFHELLDLCYTQGGIPKDFDLMARKADCTREQLDRIWTVISKHFQADKKDKTILINRFANAYRRSYFSYISRQKSNRNAESAQKVTDKPNTVREMRDGGGNQEEKRREEKRREEMIVVPPPPIQTEYPETLATIHSNPLCAAAEPKFAVQLVADSIQRALSENLKVDLIDDHAVACAVRHSFKTGPEKHKAGLLLRTVPQIICTWLRQKQESKPDAGGVYIDGVLAGEYMRRLETT